MWTNERIITILVLLLWGLIVWNTWYRRRRKKAEAAAKEDELPRCARCGYDLSRLEYPRCPECGALRGFKVPVEDLGLTDEEVRSGFKKQRETRQTPGQTGGPANHP